MPSYPGGVGRVLVAVVMLVGCRRVGVFFSLLEMTPSRAMLSLAETTGGSDGISRDRNSAVHVKGASHPRASLRHSQSDFSQTQGFSSLLVREILSRQAKLAAHVRE